MFLIMGFAHIVAAFVLFLTYPQSTDTMVHFIGGIVELAIGVYIFFSNDCKFSI